MPLALVTILVLYFETFVSMMRIWLEIDTFSHGFIIFPISAYLIWQDRDKLSQLKISRSIVGLITVATLSIVWWLSNAVGVQVASQFAAVAMIAACVLTLNGPQFTRAIAFPLAYLLFAVPFGAFLIPHLIDFTAFFVVASLNAFDIPIYRDGAYFYIPTGSYEVATACSGIRFVIVTFAISALFGHGFFYSYWRILAYVCFAIALAIFANGIRATVVVLVLHLTDFDIAAGQDHEFVGWLVYGLLIILLLMLASKFRDEPVVSDPEQPTHKSIPGKSRPFSASFTILAILAIAIGPLLSYAVQSKQSVNAVTAVYLPVPKTGWSLVDATDVDWRPDFGGSTGLGLATFTHDSGQVDVAIARYLGVRQGAELSNAANSVVDQNEWKIVVVRDADANIDTSKPPKVLQALVRRRDNRDLRLVWYWTEVNGTHVRGALQTKLAEIRNTITFTNTRSSAVIISAQIKDTEAATQQLLQRFVQEYYVNIMLCNNATEGHDSCTAKTAIMSNE